MKLLHDLERVSDENSSFRKLLQEESAKFWLQKQTNSLFPLKFIENPSQRHKNLPKSLPLLSPAFKNLQISIKDPPTVKFNLFRSTRRISPFYKSSYRLPIRFVIQIISTKDAFVPSKHIITNKIKTFSPKIQQKNRQ